MRVRSAALSPDASLAALISPNGVRLVDVSTGAVRMTVPELYSAELETGTTNGPVNVDFPVMVQGRFGRHLSTTLGSGGAKVRVITTNGGVTIRRR